MAIEYGQALSAFVAISLVAIAVTVFAAGRRRPEALVLGAFLGLIAVNFGAPVAYIALGGQDERWLQLEKLALALDPPFLLAFVVLYPYRRLTRPVKMALAAFAVTATLLVLIALLRPERLALGPNHDRAEPFAWEWVLLMGQLVAAYTAAWVLAVRSVIEAPTRLLARQASWVLAAVGVAVVPRVGLLHNDFEVGSLFHLEGATLVLDLVLGLGLPAVLFAAGWAQLRRSPRRSAPEAHAMMRFVGLAVAALVVLRIPLDATLGVSVVYPLRWPLFAVLILWGMLSFEVVELRRARERTVPLLGAVLGAAGIGLMTATVLSRTGSHGDATLALGIATALGASAPAAAVARALAGLAERGPGLPGQAERRLELYRAALESGWARGAPGAEVRRRLERERRAFGVSQEEARALEHVIASQLTREPQRLRPGDEPAPGILLQEVLGEGAHGRVFAARRFPSGERVVVKEFHADRLGDAQSRARMLREFQALRALDHPNIVKPLDVQASKGRYLLVLEHVDGAPLDQVFASGPFGPERVRALLLDLLDALATAHARGVVHRDLKPSNILLGRDGHARLTDFGLASSAGRAQDAHGTIAMFQALEGIAGTLAYMAPEQARGGAPGPAADLYALGMVAYEALTGKPALDLRNLGFFEALQEAAQPRVELEGLPHAWQPLLRRALDPDPKRRWASAAEFRAAVLTMDRPVEVGDVASAR